MTTTAFSLRLIKTIIVGGVAGAVFALAPTASAATSQSFQISPPTANYPANPGDSVHNQVKVTNLTDSPLVLRVDKANFVAKGEEGEVELVDNAAPLYSLAPWFNILNPTIDVPARQTKEVAYDISVPAGAEPGGRYGSIVFHTVPQPLPAGQSGASVQQSIGALVFLRINGPANENLSIASFASDKSFYEYGPAGLTARIKNVGTVHEKPTGTITIKNFFGAKVATIPLDEHFVIPGAIRRLHNDWPGKNSHRWLIGRYTAELSASYGAGKALTASTSFTIIPYRLLAIILLVIIILLIIILRGRKRFGRAIRILAGRE